MTTPRDAIGLSERLAACPDDAPHFMRELMDEAATQLDSLQARVKELEENITEIPQLLRMANARATSAEQQRDKLQGMLLLCGELGGIGKDETPVAYLRRLIDGLIDAARERDEAYELAAKVAEQFGEPYALNTNTGAMMFCAVTEKIAAAIRRLAAGTENEGK